MLAYPHRFGCGIRKQLSLFYTPCLAPPRPAPPRRTFFAGCMTPSHAFSVQTPPLLRLLNFSHCLLSLSRPSSPSLQAKEYGEAEVWMNERMMRLGGDHIATFVTAFDERKRKVAAAAALTESSCIWLVWRDEGAATLDKLMQVGKKGRGG